MTGVAVAVPNSLRFAPARYARGMWMAIGTLLLLVSGAGGDAHCALASHRGDAPLEGFRQRVPGALAELAMVPIPAGRLVLGAGDGAVEHAVGGYWMSAFEITWEAFDAFVFEADDGVRPAGVDALARPTVPYISADRGFGREGYPVLSVSLASAQAFCDWLSAHTGRRWRLPDEAEWTHAALAGSVGPWHAAEGFDGRAERGLERIAWYRENAGGRTHPAGSLAPNAFGLFDMHGNVAEWVRTEDGRGLLAGGSFLDGPAHVSARARKRPEARWNASDPNLPKSRWWLADAPFAGFRVIAEAPPEETAPEEAAPENSADEQPAGEEAGERRP